MKEKFEKYEFVDDNFYPNSKKELLDNSDFVKTVPGNFHIGQGYTEQPCDTIVCKKCGNYRFIVGCGDYYTAIKCETCGWEICIHEG